MTRKNKILNFISSTEYVPMNIKDIMALLAVPRKSRNELENILNALEAEGEIYKNSKNKYISVKNSEFKKGIFYSKSAGYGFVICDNGDKYFVNPCAVNGAFNKDTVLFKETRKSHSADKCNECVIIKILNHSTDAVVGTFVRSKNFGFVIPDNKSLGTDIYIPKKNCSDVQDNQKVTVKITKWSEGDANPEGIIEEILGFEGEKGVDIKSIICEHGFEEEFSEKAELSALAFGNRVYEEEISDRRDFRNRLIFTIDGDDSRDFDDAVEIEKTNNGYRLGVHISDVSYYVAENSALDIEAAKRGTSVYLPDRVIPMLPTRLSNGLCSLNPGVDRLTLSVIMDFDENGELLNHCICEGVICSKYRMTYNQVAKIITGDKYHINQYPEIYDSIMTMTELCKKLRSKRMAKGSIDFNFPEVKIKLDDDGKVCDIYKYVPTEAHQLIEEFMLAANCCVAEEMFWSEIPFIYRIHEKPSPDKTTAFAKFIAHFGYVLKGSHESPHPHAFADIINQIKDTDKELLISKVMLRSLMKAKYSDENREHFGLAFKYYCHFTSPIRRYPDLVIHRIIKEHLKYGLPENRRRFLSTFVKKHSASSSDAEIRATIAEREADDLKKTEYMSYKIGQIYHATVTSVTSFGIFAETDFGVEGLISMTDLNDDYYEYDEASLTLVGKHTGKVYTIGNEFDIKVKRADTRLREIDYIIEGSAENE